MREESERERVNVCVREHKRARERERKGEKSEKGRVREGEKSEKGRNSEESATRELHVLAAHDETASMTPAGRGAPHFRMLHTERVG